MRMNQVIVTSMVAFIRGLRRKRLAPLAGICRQEVNLIRYLNLLVVRILLLQNLYRKMVGTWAGATRIITCSRRCLLAAGTIIVTVMRAMRHISGVLHNSIPKNPCFAICPMTKIFRVCSTTTRITAGFLFVASRTRQKNGRSPIVIPDLFRDERKKDRD